MVVKRIGVATLVGVLGLAVAGTVPVRAAAVPSSAAHWSIVSSPNVAGDNVNVLQGVSCTTSAFCMAVGNVQSTAAIEAPLAEEWNGSTVRVVSTPNPLAGGPGDVILFSVSCTSTTFCMAVGESNVTASEGLEALFEQWNGTTWTMTTPADIELSAVSCVSSTFCFALGESGSGSAVIEHWNGLTWTEVATPTPTYGILSGIKCTSISFCMVVGTAIEQWNGAVWSLDAPQANDPNYDVACPTTTFCVGTGPTLSSIEQWNGSVWSLSTAGASNQDIAPISCLSPTSCTAVGDVEIYNGVYRTFIEHWNGATWTVMTSANSPRTNNGLLGVKCTSATFCIAVGYHATTTTAVDDTLVEKY
jgi:hypothetical protein